MTYTDLAQRLEAIDSKLSANDRDASKNLTTIRRLESQLETTRSKLNKLREARLALIDQRETVRREFNARLG